VFFFSNYRLGQVAGGWSLSTEEQFYIFTPLLLLLTRKLPISRMWIVLAAMFVALPLMRYLTYSGWQADGGQGVPPPSLLYWPFHLHADGLVMGLFLAWLATARPAAIAARDAARNWVAPLVLFLAGCALRQFEKYTFAYTGLALIYGGMTLFMLRDRSWITRLSAWRGFHTISRLSYGMYLNHFFVVPQVFEHVDAPAGGFDLLRFGAVYGTSLVLSMAAAAVTFCLVEHPFLMLRERWLEARRKTAVQRTA
jgi:peptidoglycan/LPS O-acetylase OafA/YrhL